MLGRVEINSVVALVTVQQCVHEWEMRVHTEVFSNGGMGVGRMMNFAIVYNMSTP